MDAFSDTGTTPMPQQHTPARHSRFHSPGWEDVAIRGIEAILKNVPSSGHYANLDAIAAVAKRRFDTIELPNRGEPVMAADDLYRYLHEFRMLLVGQRSRHVYVDTAQAQEIINAQKAKRIPVLPIEDGTTQLHRLMGTVSFERMEREKPHVLAYMTPRETRFWSACHGGTMEWDKAQEETGLNKSQLETFMGKFIRAGLIKKVDDEMVLVHPYAAIVVEPIPSRVEAILDPLTKDCMRELQNGSFALAHGPEDMREHLEAWLVARQTLDVDHTVLNLTEITLGDPHGGYGILRHLPEANRTVICAMGFEPFELIVRQATEPQDLLPVSEPIAPSPVEREVSAFDGLVRHSYVAADPSQLARMTPTEFDVYRIALETAKQSMSSAEAAVAQEIARRAELERKRKIEAEIVKMLQDLDASEALAAQQKIEAEAKEKEARRAENAAARKRAEADRLRAEIARKQSQLG